MLQMKELEFIYVRYLQMYWQPPRGVAFQLGKWVRGLNLAIKNQRVVKYYTGPWTETGPVE